MGGNNLSKCYNSDTVNRNQLPKKTTNIANIAFGIVVLGAYFATFSAIKEITPLDLICIVVFGIAYITLGIYGFGFAVNSELLTIRFGYILFQVILGGLIVALGKGAGFSALILLPLAGHAVVLLTETWAYVACLTIVAGYAIAVGALTGNQSETWSELPIFLSGLIFIVVFTQVAVGEERSRKTVERLNDELMQANKQLREYASQIEELVTTQERNRMAREIHDGLGHYLTTIFMEIQAAQVIMDKDPRKALQMLEKAQDLSQDALVDVRASVAALRVKTDAQNTLSELIKNLLHSFKPLGINSNLVVVGNERVVNPLSQMSLYRVAQECISNICKHSKAKNVIVTIGYGEIDWINLVVQDDGIGAEQMEGGFGLIGLQERVNLLRGEIHINSEPGKGFTVEVRVPG